MVVKKFSKILVAVDGSEPSMEASDYAVLLAKTIVVTPVSVVGAMIDYAEKERADLIVIGTRGRSGFKKMLLGSVASGVVKYSHCPVLVVK